MPAVPEAPPAPELAVPDMPDVSAFADAGKALSAVAHEISELLLPAAFVALNVLRSGRLVLVTKKGVVLSAKSTDLGALDDSAFGNAD